MAKRCTIRVATRRREVIGEKGQLREMWKAQGHLNGYFAITCLAATLSFSS
jgi:hypothetical protein